MLCKRKQVEMVEMVFENQEVCCRITYLPLVGRQQKAVGYNTIREFGIKHNCYSWRDSHFFNWPILVQKAWLLILNAPINPFLVRIFIVSEMRLLSAYNALLD